MDKMPALCHHTPAPRGYIQWHEWAHEKAKTHKQRRCLGCGRYAIWQGINMAKKRKLPSKPRVEYVTMYLGRNGWVAYDTANTLQEAYASIPNDELTIFKVTYTRMKKKTTNE